MIPPTQLVPVRRYHADRAHPARTTPTTSRRTLARAAGHAAWTAPFISIATSAPAAAAASVTGTGGLPPSLQASLAGYHFHYYGLWSGLVPVIGVTNPTAAAVSNLWVTLTFASDVFPGVYRDTANGGPLQPAVATVGAGLADGWSAPELGSNGDQVTVTFAKAGLDAGGTTVIGDPGSLTGVMLTWASYVSTDTVPFNLGADGIRTLAGALSYLDTM